MSYAPYVPEGFDDFWCSASAEAESAVLDFTIGELANVTPNQDGQTSPGIITTDHQIRTLTFRGIAGESLNGWLATPLETTQPAPGFLWLAPYGRESVLPNQYGTRPGMASLSFNYFSEPAFHQEKYVPVRGYFAEGASDPSTWVFRQMFQNAILASRVLESQPAFLKGKMGAMGMSQGGGMSIWLGAWCPRVKAVCADMPFLAALHETLLNKVYRYPLKELLDFMATIPDGQKRVMETIAFYDTLNQATRCAKPTLVSYGTKDPAVKADQVQAVFDALPGDKRLIEYDCGHDWHPDMIANNQHWLLDHFSNA